MPSPEQLDDRRRSIVEKALLALDAAQEERVSAQLRLAFLFESDPERAAEIGSWLL